MPRRKSARKSPSSARKSPKKSTRRRKKSTLEGITDPAIQRLIKHNTGIKRVSRNTYPVLRTHFGKTAHDLVDLARSYAEAANRKTIMASDVQRAIEVMSKSS
jgi:histone H3/H4